MKKANLSNSDIPNLQKICIFVKILLFPHNGPQISQYKNMEILISESQAPGRFF